MQAFSILSLSTLTLFSSIAFAGGEIELLSQNPAVPDARILALGGAGVGLRSGFASTWYNPAAIAHENRIRFASSFSYRDQSTTSATRVGDVDGAEIHYDEALLSKTEKSHLRLDQVGAVFPVPVYRGGLALSIGYATLQSFDMRQEYDLNSWSIRHSEEGALTGLLVGCAVQLSSELSAGLTLVSYGGGHDHLHRESSTSDESLLLNNTLSFSGSALRLGLMFRPTLLPLQFGMRLALPSKIAVEWEQSGFEYIDEGGADLERYDYLSGNSYEIKTPPELALGVAWQERFYLVTAEAALTDWSLAGYDDLSGGWDAAFNEDEIERGFESSWRYSLGAELQLPHTDLLLRAGVWKHDLPHKDAYLNDLDDYGNFLKWNILTDEPRYGFSVGAAWIFSESVTLSLSAARETRDLDRLLWEDANSAARLKETHELAHFRLGFKMFF
jgi:hypothetical protein